VSIKSPGRRTSAGPLPPVGRSDKPRQERSGPGSDRDHLRGAARLILTKVLYYEPRHQCLVNIPNVVINQRASTTPTFETAIAWIGTDTYDPGARQSPTAPSRRPSWSVCTPRRSFCTELATASPVRWRPVPAFWFYPPPPVSTNPRSRRRTADHAQQGVDKRSFLYIPPSRATSLIAESRLHHPVDDVDEGLPSTPRRPPYVHTRLLTTTPPLGRSATSTAPSLHRYFNGTPVPSAGPQGPRYAGRSSNLAVGGGLGPADVPTPSTFNLRFRRTTHRLLRP
jgi:hypothetical protein